jgi:hypothetical protein
MKTIAPGIVGCTFPMSVPLGSLVAAAGSGA